MLTQGKNEPEAERQDTDESLRCEREKTDKELSERRLAVQEDADSVVLEARDRADEVLKTAREKADVVTVNRKVSNDRVAEDDKLKRERFFEDEQLRTEREDREKSLKELLQIERETTNEHLLIERARSDEALGNRDDFMGMVSHDLRTLLGGIALSAAMILKETATSTSGTTIPKRAELIQRFVARTTRLVNDLVDVTSIEAGKLRVAIAPDDAVRPGLESAEAFQSFAKAKSIHLKVEMPGVSVPASFDHDRILQVLANLLSNAIKFTEPGGNIILRLELLKGKVRFAVSDDGPGIRQEDHAAVFNQFWQSDKSDRRGMGLGLFISKCLVEAHGGTIWVESTPGHGSIFQFEFPA